MSCGKYESSQVQYDVVLEKNVMVTMSDGVRLATDVFRPALEGSAVVGRFPTIIERTPYDNGSIRLTNVGRHYARRGYVCIMQDVRGRGESDGDWFFLLNPKDEAKDGHDTLAWIVEQPWSDGQVGTIGLSYTGATQQALAVADSPGLKAQFIMDCGYNYHTHTIRAGGAFTSGVLFPYAFRMARDGKEAQRDPLVRRTLIEAYPDLAEWFSSLPLKRGGSPLSVAPTYEDMLLTFASRGDYDEFWKNPASNMEEHIDNYADVPVFLLTSWYGHHPWATTTKYVELRKRLKSPVRMVVGTWLHGYDTLLESWSGEVDFGLDAILDNIEDLRLKWFDHFLKGMHTDVVDGPPTNMFIMGGGTGRPDLLGRMLHGGQWRREDDWPPRGTGFVDYFLQPEGGLSTEGPVPEAAPSRYTFDPADPVPTLGGCIQTPGVSGIVAGGAFDQRGRPDLFFASKDNLPFGARNDVLVFETPPLEQDIEVTGPVVVQLWASSSAPDTDFTAKLLDVYPPSEDYPLGFAMNLCDGIIRARYRNSRERAELMEPGEIYSFDIDLQATGNLFKRGHRIRLDISSSNFPQFDVNPNTGAPLWSSGEVRVAHQGIYHDSRHPSRAVLPIVPTDRGDTARS
jgi:putative CocE/NonD family hydrolase